MLTVNHYTFHMQKILSNEAIARLKRKITHRHRVNTGLTFLPTHEIIERDEWCRENIKRSWQKSKSATDQWMWCFCNAVDATAFKLRWF